MKKWLIRIALLLGGLSLVLIFFFYMGFRASLPTLEGEIITSNISAPVKLERDENGEATVSAENRADLSYVVGYLHAQERFFQMDLTRRMAAGELSELFGSLAIATDKDNRIHRFRSRAKVALELLSDFDREQLNRYSMGVNDGLNALGSKPFEYWLLGVEPKIWSPEDSLLAVYSFFFTLQSSRGGFEWQNHLMRASLPDELANFLLPLGTEWDAPLQSAEEMFRIIDVPAQLLLSDATPVDLKRDQRPMLGSNNWAVGGSLTATGAGMVSNDMHLSIRAPSIWYKVRMKLNDGSLDITGATLAGVPVTVVGSNGHIAWGFTNSNIDTSDLIELKINPGDDNQYLTKEGYQDFQQFEEEITVAGGAVEKLIVEETIWGPVLDLGDGKKYAYRWVAHMPDGVNIGLIQLEKVKTVNDALALADDMGIPAQNAMIVDEGGNAAWTLFGRLPVRSDGDYIAIQDWSDGDMEWDSWYPSSEYPKVLNPENHRLWTANARVASGENLKKIGYSRYDLGARAHQIRQRLEELDYPVEEADLYAIMLDDEAIFLTRWREKLSDILRGSNDDAFKLALTAIDNWDGHADKTSIGYRLVKEFRDQVFETLMAVPVAACVAYHEDCDYDRATRQWERPLWQLVTEQPEGWLPEGGNDWQFFFEQQAFEAWKPLLLGEIALDNYIWGEINRSEIGHPLAGAVPFLGKLTDMPNVMQSGATEDLPYITGRAYGQSERMVVSPGQEESGIMNLPAGQSAHPLSPYYGAGHAQWAEGIPMPFLPQETKWTLEFIPQH